MKKKQKLGNQMNRKIKAILKDKYNFFLNPYSEYAFHSCPKCHRKTSQKKKPLVIFIPKVNYLLSLNKTCKYCSFCDLLIAKKEELDSIMAHPFQAPNIKGKDYAVVGVQDKSVWRKGFLDNGKTTVEGISLFKNVWTFEVEPGGWCFDGKK